MATTKMRKAKQRAVRVRKAQRTNTKALNRVRRTNRKRVTAARR